MKVARGLPYVEELTISVVEGLKIAGSKYKLLAGKSIFTYIIELRDCSKWM
jgi:hypothetical protein